MIVVTVTDCPPRLRGDLSKWLLEINRRLIPVFMSAN